VTTEIRVGAHEFRNRFGWYAERAPPARSSSSPAVAKPYARLTAAHLQLAIAS